MEINQFLQPEHFQSGQIVSDCVMTAFDAEMKIALIGLDALASADHARNSKEFLSTKKNFLMSFYRTISDFALHDYFIISNLKRVNELFTDNQLTPINRLFVLTLNNTVAGALGRLYRVYSTDPELVITALINSVCHIPSQQYCNDPIMFWQKGDADNLNISPVDVSVIVKSAPVVGVLYHIRQELGKSLLVKTLTELP